MIKVFLLLFFQKKKCFLSPYLYFLLAGCTVGPHYVKPQVKTGTDWHDENWKNAAGVTEASNPDPVWWNAFHDPTLTMLMQRAIADNPTLKESLLRVIESHQNEITAGAAGLPTLSGNAKYTREQLGLKGILESKGAYSQLSALANSNSPINQLSPGLGGTIANTGTGLLNTLTGPISLSQYGFSSSWELDLFGKVRRSVEQARANTRAQIDAARDSLVMLESQVAQTYFQLRAAQMGEREERADIAAANQSLRLTARRARFGLTTQLDVLQARTQFLSYETKLPGYQTQIQKAINQIDVLTGQPPGALDAILAQPAPLPPMPALIGVGVPSTLAERRPDIRQAEAQLHAAIAGVGVAVASFYPDITLSGSVGLRATDISYLTNWASLFYTLGPSISLPIFQGGQLTAQLRTARAQAASAVLNYRNTVLNALREVEDALVSYRSDQSAARQTDAEVQAGALSLYLAENRYRHGLTSYLAVLTARQTLTSARQQLIQQEASVANDAVTLYTALGGGWQESLHRVPVPRIGRPVPPTPAAADALGE